MGVRIIISLAILNLALANIVYAEVDLKSYIKLRQNNSIKERFKDYTTGVGRGVFWANTMISIQGGQKLFCMPPRLSLDDGLIQSLLEQEIRVPFSGKPYADNTPIEAIMVQAFKSRFPCYTEANNLLKR